VKFGDLRFLFQRILHTQSCSRPIGAALNFFVSARRHFSRARRGGETGLRIDRLQRFDECFDPFWDEVRSLFPICIERTTQFLRWRYRRPEEDYQILRVTDRGRMVGYAVIKMEKRFDIETGYILDFITVPEERYVRFLLTGVEEAFRREKPDIISVLMPKDAPYYKAFRRHGYISVPKRFFPKEIYFHARTNIPLHEKEKEIRNPKNWFISWGDTDLL
jgi:hypothetical protein